MTRSVATTRLAGQGLAMAGGATTDNVNCLRTSTLADMTLKTVACWLNATSAGGANTGRLFRRNTFVVQFGGVTSLTVSQTATGNGTWTLDNAVTPNSWPGFGVWFHLAVTYDKGALGNVPLIYVNGVAQTFTATTQPTGSITADGVQNFVLGNTAAAAGTRAYDGKLSNVAIYSRILSPAEILSLYNGVDPSSTNLVLKYRFAEGTGTSTRDESGNGFQGTLLGATWTTTPIPLQRTVAATRTIALTRAVAA